jgi:teichuronic acid biosynthesis glycosyltransferase TuaG
MPPAVSVIIPTWNRKNTLKKAIESVQNQTLRDIEILVCDDGSSDGSSVMVKEMSSLDHRVRWVPGKHAGGPATPRNVGIQQSLSPWVAFLDSDDMWSANKLKMQLAFAKAGSYDMVCANAYRVSGNKKVPYFLNDHSTGAITFSRLLLDNRVICSTVMIKRDVVKKVGGFPEAKRYVAIEDYLAWLKTASRFRIGYQSDLLASYRDDPKNSLRKNWKSVQEQTSTVLVYITDWMAKNRVISIRYAISYSNLLMHKYRTACL